MILETRRGKKCDIAVLSADRSKWIEVPVKLPADVRGAGVVYLNKQIYIVGSNLNRRKLRRLPDFEQGGAEWEELAEMHIGREGIKKSCLEWNGSIWVLGGQGKGNLGDLTSVERYDPKENKWFKMP